MKRTDQTDHSEKIKIKICGLTKITDALGCADLGADALGFVFYPKSPRHLTDDKAREIIRHIPAKIKTIGVFVNETFSTIMRKVEYCGLSGVQLHGREPQDLVARLLQENLCVIKALFVDKSPFLADVEEYAASAYLAEFGKGPLPGGNALPWDYGEAKAFSAAHPLILAGGLKPENVRAAIRACLPVAVDVSSGVEKSPGIKDLERVKLFFSEDSREMA